MIFIERYLQYPIAFRDLSGSELGLDGLRCLCLDHLVLPVQHVELFEASVELEDKKDQCKDTDKHQHPADINRKIEHAPILIVIELPDKRL